MSAAVLFLELRLPPASMYIYIYVFWFQLYGPKKDTLWLFKSFQWNPWPIGLDHSHFAKLKFTPLSPKKGRRVSHELTYPRLFTQNMSIQVWEDVLSEYQKNAFHPMHSTLNELGVSRKQATLQISDGLKFMLMHLPHEYGNKLEHPTFFGCVWVFCFVEG